MNLKMVRNYEEVLKVAEETGFEVITKLEDFKGAGQNCTFKCPNGHIRHMLPGNFKKRKSCGECLNCNIVHKYEDVKKHIEDKGWELISKEYKNCHTLLEVKCPNEHIIEKTFNSFRANSDCYICVGNYNFNIDIVKEKAKDFGFEVLSDTYENNVTKLLVKCEEGHITAKSWQQIGSNRKCSKCVGGVRLTQEEAEEQFREKGCELLEEYKNSETPHKYKCVCGNIAYTYTGAIRKGILCGCQRLRGEEHPYWNPEKTDEEREQQRKNVEVRIWRESVFERDDYTCQCCGEKGGRIEAHHKYSWSSNKDKRYDVDNGATLCRECHRKGVESFHSLYGIKNNTEEQYNEFIRIYGRE